MISRFCVGPTSKKWFIKIVQMTIKHVGIHVEFTSILPFTYFVGPSSVVCSELGPAPPFPPMRVLEVYRSQALSLVCEVALGLVTLH